MEDTVLKNLVIFIVALAIAGTLVSTGYYFAVQPPGQTVTTVPKNSAEWGGIQIWSTPGNAYVSVEPSSGGMSYGGWTDDSGSTQFSVEPYRNYKVTVSKDGFRTYSATVYVDSTSWTVVTATL